MAGNLWSSARWKRNAIRKVHGLWRHRYKPDFAIIGEPNQWDRVALGYKGSAWANVTVKRGQAHTASGEETAAKSAVEVWLKIKAYVDSFNADKPKVFDKLLLTLRGMDSDSNDFEQWARLKVGVRLPVEVSPEDWYAKLNEIISDSHLEGDCHLMSNLSASPSLPGDVRKTLSLYEPS